MFRMWRLKALHPQSHLVIGFMIAASLTGLVDTLVGIRIINTLTLEMIQNALRAGDQYRRLIYNYHHNVFPLDLKAVRI